MMGAGVINDCQRGMDNRAWAPNNGMQRTALRAAADAEAVRCK